jgi:hypothetical protein
MVGRIVQTVEAVLPTQDTHAIDVNPLVQVDATGGLRPQLAFNWRVFSPTYGPIFWISRFPRVGVQLC